MIRTTIGRHGSVSRQVYAETCIVPFQSNAFRFEAQDCFDWMHRLIKVQRDAIREIHIVTWRAQRFYGWIQGASFDSELPNAIYMRNFHGLKRVVVEVREEHGGAVPTGAVDEVEVEKAQEKIKRKVRAESGEVEVTFVRSRL
jgi:hypothetical protein